MRGSTYRRCRCRQDGKELGTKCPLLRRADGSWNPGHGSWYFRLELDPEPVGEPDEEGQQQWRRQYLRRGGFASQKAAQAALDDAKDQARKGIDVNRRQTVAQYLREWLAGKSDIRRSTLRSYTQHVENLWIPACGRHEVGALRRSHVQAALDSLECSPATKQRYRATLRSALSDAMREGLVTVNVAKLVKIAAGKRPKARVWTDARVVAWQAEQELRLAAARDRVDGRPVDEFRTWHGPSARPSRVMVWTPAQTGQFLDHAANHPLYPLFHLIAFRGLRRGEACGVRREDLDLEGRVLSVQWQITESGGHIDEGAPKTDSSDAAVALDTGTVAVLRAHLERQVQQRQACGSAWVESGYVFTREDGSRLDPARVTDEFERLAFDAGLPPITLHGLRHGAASIMHTAGLDMKVIQKTLRHSTSVITADTYTSVFDEVDRAAAEATAAVVPLKARAAS